MRVGLVLLHADPARGGAERYTHDLAAALRDRGLGVTLIAARIAAAPDGVGRVELPPRGLTRLGRYRRFIDAVDAHAAAAEYDVVHAMMPLRRCDLYHPHAGIERANAAGPRHALDRKRRGVAGIETALLRDARPIVICLSQSLRAAALRWHADSGARFEVLLNGVDLSRFVPATATRDAGGGLRLLIVAQDFARKGVATAIRALARLPGATLDVVGRDEPRPYRDLAARAGLSARVTFHGAADVRPFYAAADALVLPTRHDPCSLVVLEALACGLPVVTTRRNGASEAMVDGVHGYVLEDPDDDEALAERLARLSDPARRGSMRLACVALRPALAFERHVQRLLALYAEAIASRDGRADAAARG